jgi:hypothetical protein
VLSKRPDKLATSFHCSDGAALSGVEVYPERAKCYKKAQKIDGAGKWPNTWTMPAPKSWKVKWQGNQMPVKRKASASCCRLFQAFRQAHL